MFSSTAGSKHSNILYSGNEHEVLFLAVINCVQEYLSPTIKKQIEKKRKNQAS